MEKRPCVYILASKRNGTLYAGVTSDLPKRLHRHRNSQTGGFVEKYGVRLLVWFEMHDTIEQAILREKRIKEWKRSWKLELIEKNNPAWCDLADDIL